MKKLTVLTAEQTKRVKKDLFDTERMLNKELSYSKDLQNNTHITQLKAHIVKLNEIILNGWNAPKF